MEDDEESYLVSTYEEEKINETKNLYEDLKVKQEVFCNTFNIHCKKNCGECCKHFVPDITEAEALVIAEYVVKNNKSDEFINMLDKYESESDLITCPFYDDIKHCTIYEIRPLICRLFNAAASNNKNGEPVFRSCKYNDSKYSLSKDDFIKNESALITMEEYGEQLEAENSGSNENDYIFKALKKAIYKLELLKSYNMK